MALAICTINYKYFGWKNFFEFESETDYYRQDWQTKKSR